MRCSVIRQPEPKLSKVNVVDVIFCCMALFVQPGIQRGRGRNDQHTFVSRHSKKPHVSGSDFLGDFFIKNCQLNLSNRNILIQGLSDQAHLIS